MPRGRSRAAPPRGSAPPDRRREVARGERVPGPGRVGDRRPTPARRPRTIDLDVSDTNRPRTVLDDVTTAPVDGTRARLRLVGEHDVGRQLVEQRLRSGRRRTARRRPTDETSTLKRPSRRRTASIISLTSRRSARSSSEYDGTCSQVTPSSHACVDVGQRRRRGTVGQHRPLAVGTDEHDHRPGAPATLDPNVDPVGGELAGQPVAERVGTDAADEAHRRTRLAATHAATFAALPPRRRSMCAGVSVPSAGVRGDAHDDVLEQVPDDRQHRSDEPRRLAADELHLGDRDACPAGRDRPAGRWRGSPTSRSSP